MGSESQGEARGAEAGSAARLVIDLVDAMRERGAKRVVIEAHGVRLEADGFHEPAAPAARRRVPVVNEQAEAAKTVSHVESVLFPPEAPE